MNGLGWVWTVGYGEHRKRYMKENGEKGERNNGGVKMKAKGINKIKR